MIVLGFSVRVRWLGLTRKRRGAKMHAELVADFREIWAEQRVKERRAANEYMKSAQLKKLLDGQQGLSPTAPPLPRDDQ